LAVHPVTQAAWQEIVGNNPSYSQGNDLPVERVSWDDCQGFLQRLGEKEGHSYRLPTESEWEYACRAGTTTRYHFGATSPDDQANCRGRNASGKGMGGKYEEKTTPVGTFRPNGWGLYDMHGNVWEWCLDWYGPYPKGEAVDPAGPPNGDRRVFRGGSFEV